MCEVTKNYPRNDIDRSGRKYPSKKRKSELNFETERKIHLNCPTCGRIINSPAPPNHNLNKVREMRDRVEVRMDNVDLTKHN